MRKLTDRLPTSLLLLAGGHAMDDINQGAIPALIPFFVAQQHYGYAAAAGLTLASSLLSSVAQPAFGVLTDRFSLPWLVAVGIALAGTGVGLAGLAPTYELTWLAVALSGLGVAAFHPEAARGARMAAGTSAAGMSVFAVGGNIGFALAPVVVTPLILAAGLGATWWLAVPAWCYAALLLTLALRRGRGTARAPARAAVSPLRGADDWRSFAWLTFAVVMRSILFFGLSSLIALYAIRQAGADPAQGGLVLSTFLGSGIVGTLLGGWLADRAGRLTAMRTGYVCALPGLAALLLATSVAHVLLAAVLLGVAVYLPFSVQTTLGQEYLPTRIGTASGVTLGLAVSVGGAFAPVLGAVADAHGLPTAVTLLLALPLLLLVCSTRLRDTREQLRSVPVPRPA